MGYLLINTYASIQRQALSCLGFLELRRQRSLQYLTLSQFFSHFLRQAKGRLHTGQVFSGRKGFLCIVYTTSEGVGLFVNLRWVLLATPIGPRGGTKYSLHQNLK